MVDPATAADRVTFTLVGLLCGVGAASLSKPRFRALDYGMAVVCAGLNAWSARGGATSAATALASCSGFDSSSPGRPRRSWRRACDRQGKHQSPGLAFF